jgi:hypothetical protein
MMALLHTLRRAIPSPECFCLLLYFFLSLRPPLDGDTFLHIATGRLVCHGTIPAVDPFSHTVAGKEWIAHEWLAGVGLHLAHTRWGLGFLVWGTAVLGTLTLWLVGRLFSQGGVTSPWARGVAMFCTGVCILPITFPRPHMVTLFFLVVVLILRREAMGADRRWLLLLPPLFVIWANCHAGVILGALPFIEALFDAGVAWTAGRPGSDRRVRVLLLTGLACAAAIAINPFGPRLLLLPFTLQPGARFLRPVVEWMVPTLERAWPSVLVILAVVVNYIRRPVDTPGRLVSLLIAIYLAVQAIRNLFLIGIFGTPLLAQSLQLLWKTEEDPDERESHWSSGFRAFATVTVVALAILPWAKNHEFLNWNRFPVAAARWLKQARPPGNLYNNYNSGGYLIMALDGAYPVFMDGRIDIYERHRKLKDYFTVMHVLPGWEKILTDNAVNIVLDRNDARLIHALSRDPRWRPAFQEDGFVVLLRVKPLVPRLYAAGGPP